jgi:hypothetical protein
MTAVAAIAHGDQHVLSGNPETTLSSRPLFSAPCRHDRRAGAGRNPVARSAWNATHPLVRRTLMPWPLRRPASFRKGAVEVTSSDEAAILILDGFLGPAAWLNPLLHRFPVGNRDGSWPLHRPNAGPLCRSRAVVGRKRRGGPLRGPILVDRFVPGKVRLFGRGISPRSDSLSETPLRAHAVRLRVRRSRRLRFVQSRSGGAAVDRRDPPLFFYLANGSELSGLGYLRPPGDQSGLHRDSARRVRFLTTEK